MLVLSQDVKQLDGGTAVLIGCPERVEPCKLAVDLVRAMALMPKYSAGWSRWRWRAVARP